jgi:hypothetical protein
MRNRRPVAPVPCSASAFVRQCVRPDIERKTRAQQHGDHGPEGSRFFLEQPSTETPISRADKHHDKQRDDRTAGTDEYGKLKMILHPKQEQKRHDGGQTNETGELNDVHGASRGQKLARVAIKLNTALDYPASGFCFGVLSQA